MPNILKQKNIQFKKISWQGYSLKKSELTDEQLKKIKTDLTVAPKVVPGYGAEEPEEFELYRENTEKIYLPKHYGFKYIGKPNKDTLFKGAKIKCKFSGSLREYQQNVMDSYHKHKEKYQGGIISVGAGRGKTVMAISEIAIIGLKTLILVHNTVLLNQWRERLEQYLPDARIGIIQGKKINIKDKDVVIAMIQSLSNPKKDAEYPKEVFEEFGFLIVDECHHMGAKMFCRCLMKTMFRYCLGLSATPDRNDGLTRVFKYFLGDICFKDTAIQKTEEEKRLDHIPDAEVKVYKFIHDHKDYNQIILNWQKKPNTTVMETNISNFEPRTNFIISLIPPLIQNGRKILILTSRRDHIADILLKIEAQGVATCGPYVGGMKESALEDTKQKQVLVATYSMAEEGFDCQSLNTLIMATPKKALEQCAGRILRQKKNERIHIPLIIDLLDDFSSFSRWFKQRLSHYENKNYKLSYLDIDGQDSKFRTISERQIPWTSNSNDIDCNLNTNTQKTKQNVKLNSKQKTLLDYSIEAQKTIKKYIIQYGSEKEAISIYEEEKQEAFLLS